MNAPPKRSHGTLVSRADLLWGMVDGDPGVVQWIAAQLGLTEQQPAREIPEVVPEPTDPPPVPPPKVVLPESTGYPDEIPDLAFWLPTKYVRRYDAEQEKKNKNENDRKGKDPAAEKRCDWTWTSPPVAIPRQRPLAPWSDVWPRLRQSFAWQVRGGKIDFPKLVDRIARQELIRQIPRQMAPAENGRLTVIRDFSPHLAPYFADQAELITRLSRVFPPQSFTILWGQDPEILQRQIGGIAGTEFVRGEPIPGSRILVLGDLGVLSTDRTVSQSWLRWGVSQRLTGCPLLALFPGGLHRVPDRLRTLFDVQSWQSDRSVPITTGSVRQQQVQTLLTLAAPALRLEPGLLRDLRQLLPQLADAALEADVWNSPLLSSRHFAAATIDRRLVQEQLRPAFEALLTSLQERVLDCLCRWRKLLEASPEVWFEEIHNLSPRTQLLVKSADREDAIANWHKFDEILSDPSGTSEVNAGVKGFMDRSTRRASDYAIDHPELGPIIRKYRRRFHPELGVHPSTDPIEEIDPDSRLRTISINVTETRVTAAIPPDSPAAIRFGHALQATNDYIQIGQPERRFWKRETEKPNFVSAYGTDQYGAWYEFSVPRRDGQGVVTQRMRWIRPGTFQMGSPENEPERSDDEILHEVTLTRGYWLAETTCTQALWAAVMETEPSRFRGERLPVENVSFADVEEFIQRLSELLPGVALALPTEAQWEYACRAGTQTPFSLGETISTDQANFDGNYPYASSPKGEYRRATLKVHEPPANRWGLYQMHGNVWEWCRDWYGEYSAESQTDPEGPESGSSRVLRGGGWSFDARDVRSAFRLWHTPGDRNGNLGFRLLSSAAAEPTEAAQVPVAEQGPELARFGEADEIYLGKTVCVTQGTTAQVPLNSPDRIRIRSNLEDLYLRRTPKPPWAVDYGWDSYGVYADFEVASRKDQRPVTQRLRWVPPGQFEMGSPETESGRYDDEIRHAVTISTGFWLFDTPCTQGLWLAVMDGENPSRFTDLERPVERVSWDESVAFAGELSERMGIDFGLPSEAQWEYACRAGTRTAIYTGDLEILGDGNAPALDPIAWYGGNSGHKYDHADGDPITWLKNKQYSFEQGGARRVKGKRSNRWGLYDMLGNVCEWCNDWKEEYTLDSQVDPRGPENGSSRVLRGGSWRYDARHVRSAYRYWDTPGARREGLGFRLLSSGQPVQSYPPNK